MHLLAHPETEGLFSRVIAQSPPLHELVIDAERGRAWSNAMIARLGGSVAAARALPAQAIVDAREELLGDPAFRGTRGGAMPILDPATLPVDPATAPGVRPEIPVLIGTNADEGTFFFRGGGRLAEPDDDRLAEMVTHLAHTSEPETLVERARADGHRDNNGVLCAIATVANLQMLEPTEATALAITANDYLADAVSRHPDRLAGLACVAPQDPGSAAAEIERATSTLGLRGAIVNSHTRGEYLDAPRCEPLFAAATASKTPTRRSTRSSA